MSFVQIYTILTSLDKSTRLWHLYECRCKRKFCLYISKTKAVQVVFPTWFATLWIQKHCNTRRSCVSSCNEVSDNAPLLHMVFFPSPFKAEANKRQLNASCGTIVGNCMPLLTRLRSDWKQAACPYMPMIHITCPNLLKDDLVRQEHDAKWSKREAIMTQHNHWTVAPVTCI